MKRIIKFIHTHNEQNSYVLLIITHIFWFLVGTMLFIILLHISIFRYVDIYFYDGIIILFMACLLMMVLLTLFNQGKYIRAFNYKDIILNTVIVFSFNIIFFTHVPVTAERSVSVFVLKYMNKYSNQSFSEEEIEQVLINNYLEENEGIKKRFKEQYISGNIIKDNNHYRISEQGIFLVKFYEIIEKLFNINLKD